MCRWNAFSHISPHPQKPLKRAIPPDPILNLHDHTVYSLDKKEKYPFPLAKLANCFAPVGNQRASLTLCKVQPARVGGGAGCRASLILPLWGNKLHVTNREEQVGLGNTLTHCLSSVSSYRLVNKIDWQLSYLVIYKPRKFATPTTLLATSHPASVLYHTLPTFQKLTLIIPNK